MKETWKPAVANGQIWPYEVSDKGRIRRASPNWSSSKLTEADVDVIRKRLENDEFQDAIAVDYNVTQQTISHIATGRTWKGDSAKGHGRMLKPHKQHAGAKHGGGFSGYLRIALSKRGEVTLFRLHRVILETFIGPCPHGHEANHKNMDRWDNRLTNLEWVSAVESKRRHPTSRKASAERVRGERNPTAKLTEMNVLEILVRGLFGGENRRKLGEEFGIKLTAIKRILSGKSWSHISGK